MMRLTFGVSVSWFTVNTAIVIVFSNNQNIQGTISKKLATKRERTEAEKRVHHIYTLKNPTKQKKYKRMGITEHINKKGMSMHTSRTIKY